MPRGPPVARTPTAGCAGTGFVRGLMRSAARLTYAQVQAATEGRTDDTTDTLADGVIAPLYAAYRALAGAREKRGVLELDVPERRVVIDPATGGIDRVQFRERLDSHKLIEEFMICANVAAAEALEKAKRPCMYRVHDRPPDDKLQALRDFLDTLGINLPRGQVMRPGDLNRILAKAAGRPEARLVNEVVLRSQIAGGLLAQQHRPLRPRPSPLLPLHLADPPLRRPHGAPRPDRGVRPRRRRCRSRRRRHGQGRRARLRHRTAGRGRRAGRPGPLHRGSISPTRSAPSSRRGSTA